MLTGAARGTGGGTGGDPPTDTDVPEPGKRKQPSDAFHLAAVPEIDSDTDTAAEPDARGREPEREETLWRMPEAMIREEFGAEPANLRIVRVSGQAMEPVLRTGDRLIVDTAKRDPGAGGLFVLRGLGGGLDVWRVEPVRGSDPPGLRLSCAHPRYQDHTCLAGDLDVFGEAIRKMTRE